jgi:two-component system, sensor histidine kinase and response regulator
MEKEKIEVLYIDDDVNNLNVFRASFREDYNIHTAISAEEGYHILKENDVHVVIADQRMPGRTGVQFFESIKNEFQRPVRILLTGYTDIEAVIDAINKGQVYRYIPKPWNDTDLKLAIENAFEMYYVRKKLEETNIELSKRNEELNRFIYSASHEMKAPLKTISGILKLAEERNGSDPEKYFSMIEKCTSNLEGFVRNLVDYYRNQKYHDYIRRISFHEIFKSVIDNYLFFEHINDIAIKLSINEEIPFISDEFRVKVIMNNILSNCIKYQKKDSPEKTIHVSIETKESHATIIFRDNGIGIPEKYQGNIFNMFFRATDQGPGTGIGLYIVKEAIEKLHGTISVSSKEGEGTTFTVKIPNKSQT